MAAVRAAVGSTATARGVVVVGAAGVGKSRLAREAVHLLREDGCQTHWLIATAASQQLPLGVFATLLPEVDGDPLRVFHDVAANLAAEGHTALAVDDAHQLDDLSAALLLNLVATATVKAVVTVRAGQRVPDAVAALWKDGYLERLDVGPLGPPATRELVGSALDAATDPATDRAFTALSGGNPLYLRQIVLGELRESRLVRRDGRWRWNGDFRASPELIELVDRTALSVPDRTRGVLDVLAVAGDLDLEVLLGCVDGDDVEAAERDGLITFEARGQTYRARPSHPLYAEVRRARIGELAARRIRGTVAAALRREDGGSALMLRRAALLLDSDRAVGPELYAEAAERAVRLSDYPLGERLARAAVDAGGGFEAGMLLAFAQGWCHHLEDASATCERMVRESGTDLQRLRSTVAAAGHTFYRCGRPQEGLVVLAAGRRSIDDSSLSALLDCLESGFLVCLARPAEGVRLARSALDQRHLAPQLEVSALSALVHGLGLLGRVDEAGEPAERAWRVGSTTFDAGNLRLATTFFRVCGLVAAGYLSRAGELAERRSGEVTAGLGGSMMAGGFWGAATLACGQVGRAIEQLEACSVDMRQDTSGWRYHVVVLLARAYALAGRADDAVRTARLAEAIRHPSHLWLEPERLLTSAWVSAAQGAATEAVALCRRAARWAHEHQQHAHVVVALQTAARLGDSSVAGELRQLAEQVDGPRAAAAASHARALADADPDGLLRSAEELEAMGDLLAAADAYAQAASLFSARGRAGSRALAAEKAQHLQRTCGAVTPALRAGLHPLTLGLREREVATMAAHGLTNRDIAQRLHLSVRTVEGHLYRVFSRLGLSSRADLPAALHVTGLDGEAAWPRSATG